MIIVMQARATDADIEHVRKRIEELGLTPHVSRGTERTLIGVIGDERLIRRDQLALLPHVDEVIPILKPYKLASREFKPADTVITAAGVPIGGNELVVIAGPCSVEHEEQIITAAEAVKAAGARLLRGGAYKPRTSPYVFQGLGEEGLEYLAEAREQTGMPIVVEIMSQTQLDLMVEYVDVLQVGARNMQNFNLLRAIGETRKSVLLKRGLSATIEELLMSAEYILAGGNKQVMLCERGIRTFETATRNTTDINAIPVLKNLTHLPVILDPSHATGHWDYVAPIARAAIAAGADGLIVEVHPDPKNAASDGKQSLKPESFAEMVKQVKAIAEAMGRRIAPIEKKTVSGW